MERRKDNLEPKTQAVRVVGELRPIEGSPENAQLVTKDGTRILLKLHTDVVDAASEFAGQRVTISGWAYFNGYGQLLMIETSDVEEVDPGDDVFERAPEYPGARPVITDEEIDAKLGVAAFYGTWPGDESEEELLKLVEEIDD